MSKKGFSIADAVRQAVGDKPLEISGQVVEIPREQIATNDKNFYPMTDLEPLADSIALTGLIHPIIVKPGDNGGYILVDGERRYRAMGLLEWPTCPAIVRKPVNAVLEELALIEANRQNRKPTASDLSRQAERYQELLAQLKASGVEIPGRLRDAVAAAMQVSASKLARLKKIRSSLAPQYLELFDANELNESVAYELAQLPQERQELIAGVPQAAENLTASDVDHRAKLADAIIRDRPCPDGRTCTHEAEMYRRDAGVKSWHERCRYRVCCSECPGMETCKTVCPKLAETAAKKRQQQKDHEAQLNAERDRKDKEAAQKADADWARVRALREAAGISLDDERLREAFWSYSKFEMRDVDEYNNQFTLSLCGIQVPGLISIADLFGVPLDVLLGRETPAPPSGLEWHLTMDGDPDPGLPVVYWGAKGLRAIGPGAPVSGYYDMWPEDYAWWAYVTPPEGETGEGYGDA